MEEIIPLIFHGCKLARELESNLPNLANQPTILCQSCDQIVRIFSNTRDRINVQLLINRGGGDDQLENIGGAMLQQQKWLRYSPVHSTDLLLHPQLLEQQQDQAGLLEGIVLPNLGGGEMERWRGSGGDEVVQPMAMDVADAGRGSSSQRSTRRRKDDEDNRKVRVAAPRMGNTEIPPEDGYTWRKYGQKEILGSRFPRSYYRCTHQKLYQCPAKKQVQRLDHDPFTFEVYYRGHHICTMSSTAPSVSVSSAPPVLIAQQPRPSSQLQPPSDSVPLGHWLSMDLRPPTEESAGTSTSALVDIQRYSNFSLSGSSSDMVASGPSTLQFGRDPDQNYQPVAEFADVMFNSASSTNSNMDLIFSAAKWNTGTGDRKQN